MFTFAERNVCSGKIVACQLCFAILHALVISTKMLGFWLNKFLPMRLQIIQDGKGKNAGVFIPYDEWSLLKKQHKVLQDLEEEDETEKEQALNNIKKGLKEVRLFKLGKLKTTPAKDFLNEL